MGYIERYRVMVDFDGDIEELVKVLNSDYCKSCGIEGVIAVRLEEDRSIGQSIREKPEDEVFRSKDDEQKGKAR